MQRDGYHRELSSSDTQPRGKDYHLGTGEVIPREQEVAFREQEHAEATDWSKSTGRRKMWYRD